MKSALSTIQKICRAGKILSTVVFVCCIIGAVGCLIGLSVLWILSLFSVEYQGQPILFFIESKAQLSIGVMCVFCFLGMAVCIAEAVVSKFAMNYFHNELADGTPFTFRGAAELKQLGILSLCVSLGSAVVTGIICSVAALILSPVKEISFSYNPSFAMGIMFLVLSVVCRFGAEITGGASLRSEAAQ